MERYVRRKRTEVSQLHLYQGIFEKIKKNWKKIKVDMLSTPNRLVYSQVPSEVYLPDKTSGLVTLFHRNHTEDARIKRVLHSNF